MEETQQTTQTVPAKLTKEERSKIASEAARRRWQKAKRAKQASAKSKVSTSQRAKKSSSPREFSSALKTAEKRLAKAILERAAAGARYAVLSAEIPSLQRIIAALRNPSGFPPQYESSNGITPGNVTLEQIVGDQPLAFPPIHSVAPPTWTSMAPGQSPAAHPVASQPRAMGSAVGVELQQDDEDAFLKDSAVAGGEWR